MDSDSEPVPGIEDRQFAGVITMNLTLIRISLPYLPRSMETETKGVCQVS